MIMSGSEERVVFVLDRPGDEALLTGGTMARLASEGATVVILYGRMAAGERGAVQAALAELGVTDSRMLPQASADDRSVDAEVASALRSVIRETPATAVVIGAAGEGLRQAATGEAHSAGVPAYVSRRVTGAEGLRLTALDVSDQIEHKLGALAAYPDRWTITDRAVRLPDGSLLAVTGTETYLRLEPPRPGRDDLPPSTPLARLLAAAAALLVGAVFGLLGTIAHQSVLRFGPVTIPIGLILALVAVSALLVGLRLVLGDRMVVLACAIGTLGTIFLLSLRSTGGSVLVPAGLPGTLWTIVPALVATFVLAWPKLPAKRQAA